MNRFTLILLLCSFGLSYMSSAVAVESPALENEYFRLRLSPRTPDQLAAFYEARGFPAYAIQAIRERCFITVGLKNKSKEIVWLDLGNWRFTHKAGEIKRILRGDWRKHWQKLGLPKRFQSTFRWTLLPESLDFRPNEGEGGNITLPRSMDSFTITGTIYVGANKEKAVQLNFNNITCAQDPK